MDFLSGVLDNQALAGAITSNVIIYEKLIHSNLIVLEWNQKHRSFLVKKKLLQLVEGENHRHAGTIHIRIISSRFKYKSNIRDLETVQSILIYIDYLDISIVY